MFNLSSQTKRFTLTAGILLFFTSYLYADCLELYHGGHHPGGAVNVSFEYEKAELESTDDYLSGAGGTETWRAVHDVDGDMYGLSIRFEPPVWDRRVRFDLKYMTGELDGSFNTRQLSPAPGATFTGNVEYDRDEIEFGMDIFILNAVYARLQYSGFEMDGTWIYDDGSPNEPQEYDFDSYTIGLGFRRVFIPYEGGRFGIGVLAFAGFNYFEYEHTEKTVNATVEFEDTGYELSAELVGTYDLKITEKSFVFAGIGYDYVDTDESALDMEQSAITARLGIRISF